MADTQVREIRVVIDTKGAPGLRDVAKGFRDVNSSVQETTGVLKGFKNAFLAIQGFKFAGLGLSELVNAADSIQKLTDRLTLSEGSGEKARETLGKLAEAARTTRTGIEDIATVYSRLNLTLAQTGISTDALIGFTKALQQSFRVSGSTAVEATAATIQLSQGLASGQLRGQELRSVLEQNALAGDILAKQFKTTRGELLKFAEKNGGLDAAGVLQAFANAAGDLDAKASRLQPTIGESLTGAFNKLKIGLGDINKEFGLTAIAVKGIDLFADNIGGLSKAVTGLTAAWIAYTVAVNAANVSSKAFLALFASPIVGLIVKMGVAVGGVVTSIGALPLTLLAATGAFAVFLAESESFREFLSGIPSAIKEFVLGLTGQLDAYKKNERAAAAYKQSLVDIANANRPLIFEQPTIIKNFEATIEQMKNGGQAADKYVGALQQFSQTYTENTKLNLTYAQSLAKLNEQFLKDKDTRRYNTALRELNIQKLDEDFKKGEITLDEYNKKLKLIEFGKPKKSLDELRLDLGQLNQQWKEGQLTLGNYSDEIEKANLDKLNRDLKTGRTNVLDFNTAFNAHQINEYRRALYEGQITFQEYRNGTNALAIKQLNQQFEAGKISVEEYNRALTETSEKFQPGSALFTGTQNYIAQAGTLSHNVASAITQTFGHLEDYFVQFTKTGKFVFRDFAMAVLDDLNRIIIRALIIRPLAQGILSGISAGASSGTAATAGEVSSGSASGDGIAAAKGAAFDGNKVNYFAAGGVVNGRTNFQYAGGSGIMGERGPEAILPLRRDSGGNLGVAASGSNVQVNVINQGGGEVEQRESTDSKGNKVIDIIILSKVKEGFTSGAFDKTMAQAYGLRRRGA